MLKEFHKGNDPLNNLGISPLNSIRDVDFKSMDEFINFLIPLLPYILGTDKIPDDIIAEKGSHIKYEYYDKISRFILDRNITINTYPIDRFPFYLNIELSEMGFKTYSDIIGGKNLYEFHKGIDPLRSLSIGILNRKEFVSDEDFVDWLISIMPIVLGTNGIPNDFVKEIRAKYSKKTIKWINQIYKNVIKDFLTEKGLREKWLDEYDISKRGWYGILRDKVYDMKKKRMNEFHKGGSPLDKLGLGILNRKEFVDYKDFANWLFSLIPVILKTDKIPDDITRGLNFHELIRSDYFNEILLFLDEKGLRNEWFDSYDSSNGDWYDFLVKKIVETKNEINEFHKGDKPLRSLGMGILNKKNFKNDKDFGDWFVEVVIPYVCKGEIPSDVLLKIAYGDISREIMIHPNYMVSICDFLEERGLYDKWVADVMEGYERDWYNYAIDKLLSMGYTSKTYDTKKEDSDNLFEFHKGEDPMTSLGLGAVNMILDRTRNAFSFGRYGEEEWKKIISWLIKQKYNAHEIEEVLRSSLMRYSSDQFGANLEGLKAFNNELYKNNTQIDYFINTEIENKGINEGVGAPMATLGNTPGMGSAVPASMAATTGAQQTSSSAIGSGDKWGNSLGPYTQSGSPKKRKRKVKLKRKKINEFHKGKDPLNSLCVGIENKKDFASPEEFIDWFILMLPHICGTGEIPKDILDIVQMYPKNNFPSPVIRQKYEMKISNFFVEKGLYDEWIADDSYKSWYDKLVHRLIDMGYDPLAPETNEILEFHKSGYPLKSLGLGIMAKTDFSSREEFVDWLIAVLPVVLKTKKIPNDILVFDEFHQNLYKVNEKYWPQINEFVTRTNKNMWIYDYYLEFVERLSNILREEKIHEENISPHDKLGVAMAKKMKVPMVFKKGKGKKDVEQKKIDEDITKPMKMMAFDEWTKKFNENDE